MQTRPRSELGVDWVKWNVLGILGNEKNIFWWGV